MIPIRPRRGVTLLELLFGLAIFSGLVILVSQNLRFVTLSDRLVNKLDVLQRLRLAELQLRAELQSGTAILSPAINVAPEGGLVFTDPENRLRLLYLADDGDLSDGGELRIRPAPDGTTGVLATGVRELKVTQPVKGQVQCVLRVDGDDNIPVRVVFSGHVGNNFQGEGTTP